ncbi:PASTA domain-containing protein [Streptomyces sp. NPDC008086]|uniref:PASTA domain-containing protein n=1 Tax=unclassified Streptomyces TaxID=2593676 RepID=UPI0036826ED1
MRTRIRARSLAVGLATAALLTLTACEGTDSTGSDKPDTTAEETAGQTKRDAEATEPETDAPASETAADEAEAESETAALPDLVGKDLQAAQDEAQAAGFYVLDDQDASGQNRLQVFDRNWTVCRQEPEAGTHPTDTPVTLYAVKDDETC